LDNQSMSAWGQLGSPPPEPGSDPIEALRAISAFQKYFAAIGKDAVKVMAPPH
jgi:hypothetical protein